MNPRTLTFISILNLIVGCILGFTQSVDSSEDDKSGESDLDYYEEGADLKGRWSYLPPIFERECAATCRNSSKPFGRLVGARCQCLCPLNAPSIDLCSGNGPDICFGYCQQLGYRRGGNCLYNQNCFCYCRHMDYYDVTEVYTTPSSRSDFPTNSNETIVQ